MAYIVEALQQINSYSNTMLSKGRAFERLVKRALETHPGEYGAHRFEEIFLWSQWSNEPDYGIDLVARQTQRYGAGNCAIQCKFYGESEVPTNAVAKFLAASDSGFDSRLFIATAPIANKGKQLIDKSDPRCELLGVEAMDGWVSDWRDYVERPDDLTLVLPKHTPRPDQEEALRAISSGFAKHDRGKLILPCGTGKSLVALWAAEREVGTSGTVLYLVPSIALMGQTMTAWAQHRTLQHRYLGVCSDVTTGRRRDDPYGGDIAGLAMPVTTDPDRLSAAIRDSESTDDMLVVFATYQSSLVVADAIAKARIRFDLMICDEAHRTTGLQRLDPSFVKNTELLTGFQLVHNNSRLPADKRLFMTATPRVFTERVKERIAEKSFQLGHDIDSFSMDDQQVYGPEFHRMTFSDAIDQQLLSDYQVLVISVDEQTLSAELRSKIDTGDNLDKDTAIKLTGCWDALADPGTMGTERGRIAGQLDDSGNSLRSAIAFTNTVKTSKAVADHWWEEVLQAHDQPNRQDLLRLDVTHVDGSTPAIKRSQQLDQLRLASTNQPGLCRVISNARALTEGVDVPALDAIIFLEPRRSKIDITQAVGRVMRRATNKELGYIILPVVVPQGYRVTDDEVLNGSDFKAVWDVLRALRAHDERIDYWVNNIETVKSSDKIKLRILGRNNDDTDSGDTERLIERQLPLQLDDKVASKVVEVCGDRQFWPTWGHRAAAICRGIEQKLRRALAQPELSGVLDEFVPTMREAVGPYVTPSNAAEMIAQHLVTIPVFRHMFSNSRFVEMNPVSAAIGDVLRKLESANVSFDKEREPLARAYDQMRIAFEGAVTPAEKADILRRIYEGFFESAMKDTVKQLGIVYTPVTLVDFILRSADVICRREFGYGLSNRNVHVLDPFVGTGTFLYRLLTIKDANGQYLIPSSDVLRKYQEELHANEIVLLAYYIAALKIEAGMAEREGFADGHYEEFPGIVLQDSMLDIDSSLRSRRFAPLRENSDRARRQEELPIQVIVTNPPWSAGEKSRGDGTAPLEYPQVEGRVRDTYGSYQVMGKGGGKAFGNLYVQAMRWMSDRLEASTEMGGGGVIGFVHPNSLCNAQSLAVVRAALRDEFSSIYVINLRGNAYTSGEEYIAEGDKVFGGGSRNGVQVTFLVKNLKSSATINTGIYYAEVPAAQSLNQKFQWLMELGDISNESAFTKIPLTDGHDWVDLTDGSFHEMLPVCVSGRNNIKVPAIVDNHALGVATNMDSYVYSFSRQNLVAKIKRLIAEYNRALSKGYMDTDSDDIKWTDRLRTTLARGVQLEFDESRLRQVMYRPFVKLWLYEDDRILTSVRTVAKMFPRDASGSASTPPPPPRFPSSLPVPTTEHSSVYCRQGNFQTCAPWEQTSPAEPSHVGDYDHASTDSAFQRASDDVAARLGRDQGFNADSRIPTVEAIVLKQPGGSRGVFSTPLAVNTLPDLHLHVDGGCRIMPREVERDSR